MKQLIITRHAKSSWENPLLKDIDRPLNNRGQKDAKKMALWLKDMDIVPDLLISSNAKRAHETAKIFRNELEIRSQIEINKSLYLGDIEEFIHATYLIPDQYEIVALFGHNPGVTYFANVICEANIDNVPTTGVLIIDTEVSSWSETDISNLKLKSFIYPKQILD